MLFSDRTKKAGAVFRAGNRVLETVAEIPAGKTPAETQVRELIFCLASAPETADRAQAALREAVLSHRLAGFFCRYRLTYSVRVLPGCLAVEIRTILTCRDFPEEEECRMFLFSSDGRYQLKQRPSVLCGKITDLVFNVKKIQKSFVQKAQMRHRIQKEN